MPADGRRHQGRPKKRWRDDFDAHCNGWFEVALEKNTWNDIGEAFAQLWANKKKQGFRLTTI